MYNDKPGLTDSQVFTLDTPFRFLPYNAHTIVGLNSTEQEEKDDILRCELVVQRDGLPTYKPLNANSDMDKAMLIAQTVDFENPTHESLEKLISAVGSNS